MFSKSCLEFHFSVIITALFIWLCVYSDHNLHERQAAKHHHIVFHDLPRAHKLTMTQKQADRAMLYAFNAK